MCSLDFFYLFNCHVIKSAPAFTFVSKAIQYFHHIHVVNVCTYIWIMNKRKMCDSLSFALNDDVIFFQFYKLIRNQNIRIRLLCIYGFKREKFY
jgi:hypothetical protein